MELLISHPQIGHGKRLCRCVWQRVRRGAMHRILCLCAMLALADSEPLPATCTVAIAAPDFGILAADCIESHPDGSQSFACKIVTINGLAVTLAGMVFDGNTGLDLATVATTAMTESDSPLRAADRFAAIALREIVRSLERQRAEAWDMWSNRLGAVLARAIFAGVEGGRATLVLRRIGVSSDGLVKDFGSEVMVSEGTPRVGVFCEEADALIRSDSSLKSVEPGRLAFELIHAAVGKYDGTRSEKALE